jgi:hypothetical protein
MTKDGLRNLFITGCARVGTGLGENLRAAAATV